MTTTLTVADLDRELEQLNDERRNFFRQRRMSCDPWLVSACDAETIMRRHGAEYVEGSTTVSRGRFHLWDLIDGQVYVGIHRHGYPCFMRYGNPVQPSVGQRQ